VLALGPDTGIRDLAAVSDGILVLGGRSQGLPGRATLFHWNPATDQLRTVALLVQPADKNPEALLVVEEDAEFLHIVVMFDGETNGGPLDYFIPR
jgi:hypothetical protein